MNSVVSLIPENCPFCADNVSGKSFLESENFIAIYNIAPILPGHSLIIPRRHIKSIMDLPDVFLAEMIIFTKKTTALLMEAFSCNGFDWSVQDGISAGQTIPHLHVHIVPRKPKDMPDSNQWYQAVLENEGQLLDSANRQKLDDQDFLKITEYLRQFSKSEH